MTVEQYMEKWDLAWVKLTVNTCLLSIQFVSLVELNDKEKYKEQETVIKCDFSSEETFLFELCEENGLKLSMLEVCCCGPFILPS